jgi:FkbM family methyltransferase
MTIIYRIIYSPFINFFLRNINKLLKNLLPGVKLPPSGIIDIKLNNNEIIKLKTNQTDFVAFCVYWNGLYNYEYTWLFEKISKNINGFIDIGSNGGLYSLIAAKKSDNIKILAFDPTSAANYFFNENVRLNNFSGKIKFFNYAVSDKNETLDFFEVKNRKYPYLKYNLGGSSSLVNHPQLYNTVSVKAVSFDNFLADNPKHNFEIDFIKIDAEGAEPNIIKGMKKTIEKFKPIIVCEILLDDAGGEIEKLFLDFGYQFFLSKGKDLIPVERIQKNISDDEIYNYFLVHPSKLNIVEKFIRTLTTA